MNDYELEDFRKDLVNHRKSDLLLNNKFNCGYANSWLFNNEQGKIDTSGVKAPIDIRGIQCPDVCNFTEKGKCVGRIHDILFKDKPKKLEEPKKSEEAEEPAKLKEPDESVQSKVPTHTSSPVIPAMGIGVLGYLTHLNYLL